MKPTTTELEARIAVLEKVKKAAHDLVACLGPDGYFPTAGSTKTDALRDALALTEQPTEEKGAR